jgi:hypothetical protein
MYHLRQLLITISESRAHFIGRMGEEGPTCLMPINEHYMSSAGELSNMAFIGMSGQ